MFLAFGCIRSSHFSFSPLTFHFLRRFFHCKTLFCLFGLSCSSLCGSSFVCCFRLFRLSLVCCSRLCSSSFVCCFRLFGLSLLWYSRLCGPSYAFIRLLIFSWCAVFAFLVPPWVCCPLLCGPFLVSCVRLYCPVLRVLFSPFCAFLVFPGCDLLVLCCFLPWGLSLVCYSRLCGLSNAC